MEASTGREDLVALTVESAAMAKVPHGRMPGVSGFKARARRARWSAGTRR